MVDKVEISTEENNPSLEEQSQQQDNSQSTPEAQTENTQEKNLLMQKN